MSGCLFTVVGPSGVGKSSLIASLLKSNPALQLSVSYTTRPPRPGDIAGHDYHFLTRPAFATLAANDEFLEFAEVYGNLYGTSKKWIDATRATGVDVLLEIDWQGALAVKKIFADMVYIYIVPPSIATLHQRLVERGKDSPEVIERRLSAAREDLKHVHNADYVIINQDFSVALADLCAVTRACQLTASRQISKHADLIK